MIKNRPLYIFDLDGTLALIEHRRHFVENGGKRWKEFYAACMDDEPCRAVIETFRRLNSFCETWIWSGRSDEVRAETLFWMHRHRIRLDDSATELTMRKAGDYTPDEILKKQWLDAMLVDDRERLVAVFEDRDRMVQMWRANGVACFQVAPGAF